MENQITNLIESEPSYFTVVILHMINTSDYLYVRQGVIQYKGVNKNMETIVAIEDETYGDKVHEPEGTVEERYSVFLETGRKVRSATD